MEVFEGGCEFIKRQCLSGGVGGNVIKNAVTALDLVAVTLFRISTEGLVLGEVVLLCASSASNVSECRPTMVLPLPSLLCNRIDDTYRPCSHSNQNLTIPSGNAFSSSHHLWTCNVPIVISYFLPS